MIREPLSILDDNSDLRRRESSRSVSHQSNRKCPSPSLPPPPRESENLWKKSPEDKSEGEREREIGDERRALTFLVDKKREREREKVTALKFSWRGCITITAHIFSILNLVLQFSKITN